VGESLTRNAVDEALPLISLKAEPSRIHSQSETETGNEMKISSLPKASGRVREG
jgi:hypothetical protein